MPAPIFGRKQSMDTTTDLTAFLQALHVFGLVAYFGGTFHLVRLFLAHRSAMAKWEPDRAILLKAFGGMERKALYFLVWPALLTVITLSVWYLWKEPTLLVDPFTHVLLGFATVVLGYHFLVHSLYRRLGRGEAVWNTFGLQLFAQGATALLFILTTILIYREELGWTAGIIGLAVIGVIMLFGAVGSRKKKAENTDA